jgi:hypothetical protein
LRRWTGRSLSRKSVTLLRSAVGSARAKYADASSEFQLARQLPVLALKLPHLPDVVIPDARDESAASLSGD